MSDPQDSVLSESPESHKGPGTPTPTNPAIANLSNPRRPPRKSTLTQQQKNQKRQRATQDQLVTLEVEFNKNPTPTALVRERIASEINMTERSVQIWFQNRRAKIKNMARKSIENGEDCESIPESMRRHLAMQAMESGKAFFPSMMGPGSGFGGFGSGGMGLAADTSSGKVVIQHFNCRSLCIGSWRRVGQSQMDLIVFYSPEKACVTYYINNDSAGYKIEYPFGWIKNINLVQGDMNTAAEGASQQMGSLVVELNRPPKFYMDGSGGGGFYECSDFTEDQQASRVMVHQLGGPSKILSGQLAKLVSLESFQNRHLLNPVNNPALAVSAPVSPIGHRPASQPNHLVHPQTQMSLFPDHQPGLMGPPAPRGHKRQRSRSVPAAVDFSMLRQPMPSFVIQQQQHLTPQTPAPQMSNDAIFAPIPQHHHSANFTPSSMGPNLSIDTTAGYGMEFRQFAGPMSATTLNSPSEFGTPAFFSSGPSTETIPQNAFSTPVSSSFLNIDPAAMIGTSNTPLSIVSGDPVIADHSPPFHSVGRSQSADIFSTPGEHPSLADDSLSLDAPKSNTYKSPLGDYHYNSAFSDDAFTFSPPPSNAKIELPFRGSNLAFQTPTHSNQPPQHQDSGVAFNSSHDHIFHTPKENGNMMYDGSSSMYHSPAPMNDHSSNFQTPASHMPRKFQTPGGQLYQSPLARDGSVEGSHDEDGLNNYVQYGTIDPASL
ncbi:hypothetical protein K461DRAFT_220665 [Myriangium duriaei CBS 260.36]|uniref:Homeobox domain-containing protein n=1 Tax=Myriangium duriaei CBS 260.36 TaxID=1168546 RepID=A0A9P4J8T7_9PEZI|nr:hypothetical protein K461DRAFT_220665 [Myriangium duriaei CBS 260.36]